MRGLWWAETAFQHGAGCGGLCGTACGLRGEQIPIPARMMAISDIYDALTASDRPYKKAMSAERALDIARNSAPLTPAPSTPWPEDPPLGAEVRIRADDYGRDVVRGELIHAGIDEIAVRREDPIVGTVVVHFPRLGYDLRAA